MTAREFYCQARSRIDRFLWVVQRIIGVPDYDRYVAHVLAHHPGTTPMGREEFIAERQKERYSRPGSRCC